MCCNMQMEKVNEIEVTPAMVSAGAEVLRSNWLELRDPTGSELFFEVAAAVLSAAICGKLAGES